MGFHVEINAILRVDTPYELVKGQRYEFRKSGSRVYFDDLPIWLVRSDWTALAEIRVVHQSRTPAEVKGEFQVLHIYSPEEQAPLTEVFRRLYAPEGDPNIYLLMARADYEAALAKGAFAPASLETEKFIHAMPFNQVTRVGNKFYREKEDVQLLVVDLSKVVAPVKWEPATGGLYPHIFGELNMDSVVKVFPVPRDPNGMFDVKREDFPI